MNLAAKHAAGPHGNTSWPTLHDSLVGDGFVGPIDLLSPIECRALIRHLQRNDLPAPLEWPKGRAATDRVFYELAVSPRILDLLLPVLGDDIVLWGAQKVVRKPGQPHSWHTDLECAAPEGRFAAVWIGLRNTSRQSGLVFAAGSHRYGRPIQQVAAEHGLDHLSDERVHELASALDGAARIVRPDIADGQALIFDGRIWHAGRNDLASGFRHALLFQYASADAVLRLPLSQDYRWPFKLSAPGRLPAILVSGTDRAGRNRLVPPPAPHIAGSTPMIATRVAALDLPLAEDPVKRWRPYPQFKGSTRTLESMSCHVSVLSPGHTPHPPHVHAEEELLIVLEGEAEVTLADDPDGRNARRLRMRPGLFTYYPSTQHHTISNPGAAPVTYLMFKWRVGDAGASDPLAASVFEYGGSLRPNPPAIFQQRIFEQATRGLGKLHAHLTTMQPGAGYAPHVDAYDVAILVLTGEVETLGERVRPLGIIYYSAGEPHGMRNVGETPATYLVFEFHSPAIVAEKELARRQRGARRAKKAARAARKRRPLHRIYKHIKKLVRRLG